MAVSLRVIALIVALVIPMRLGAQSTWHVAAGATPPGLGSAASPFPTIQTALAVAMSGDTVLVQPGTYFESIDFLGKGILVRSTGGVAATTIDGGNMNTAVRMVNGEAPTTLLDGFVVTNGRGTSASFGGGISCMNSASPTIRNCIIAFNTSFAATGSSATGGGGIYVASGSAPSIDSCWIYNNAGGATVLMPGGGGGVHCTDSAVAIANSRIQGNTGSPGGSSNPGSPGWPGGGGGVHLVNSQATITDTRIDQNTGGAGTAAGASSQGGIAGEGGAGGIHALNSTVCATRVRVDGNAGGNGGPGTNGGIVVFGGVSAARPGGRGGPGGALLSGGPPSTLLACVLRGNTGGLGWGGGSGAVLSPTLASGFGPSGAAGGAGGTGGLRCDSMSPSILSCVLVMNTGNGGGVGGAGGSALTGGSGGAGGAGGSGALECNGGAAIVTGCSMGTNAGGPGGLGGPTGALGPFGLGMPGPAGMPGHGGLVAGPGSGPSVANSVLWANVPDSIAAVGGTPSVSWSDVEGGFAGAGNISVDPLWAASASGDLHLGPGSPCIDSGSNGAAALPALDFEGDPRVFHATTDMGADETILTLVLSQPGGPGTGTFVTEFNLDPGHEYFSAFSVEPCAAGPGAGPYLGLCSSDPVNLLIPQIMQPPGAIPFHFFASTSSVTFGAFLLPPLTVEGVCFDATGGVFGPTSRVARLVIQ